MSDEKQLIAVVGAAGQQGGTVVRALAAAGRFRVRALTRNPDRYRGPAEEVAQADLDRPETLRAAFEGAHGVFLVTNFWEPGTDETRQATAAVRAAKAAGVKHLIWSTLPNVEAISGGAFHGPHFTGKARVDPIVREAGFAHHTFVMAPFYYQNFLNVMPPQRQVDGTLGWALPIDPEARVIHMGDFNDLGDIVAGAFEHPQEVGDGVSLPVVGDLLSFNDVVETLNRQGHRLTFRRIPADVFAASFPGGPDVEETFRYFEAYTYMGEPVEDRIALANKVACREPTRFAAWAKANFPPAAI